jgi:AraC-like DNA-binding protein
MTMKKQGKEVARISTILTMDERIRVDAAGTGVYTARHQSEPAEVLADVKKHESSMVLVSVQYCESNGWQQLAQMIREIPRVPTVAILSGESTRTVDTVLRLGREGVKRIVDVRSRQGWNQLRTILIDEHADCIEQLIVARLQHRLERMTEDMWVFFETTLRHSPRIGSVRELAEVLQILPSTLMSRFYRAGLPTPKQYLSMVRLIRAAYLFENSGFSIANVANHLEYSSPQSFGRHIRTMMGLTGLRFREEFTGRRMIEVFERDLILPYRQVLSEFEPFSRKSR